MLSNRVIDVACAIILSNNKILVAQRSVKMSLPLKWEFPGGKVNNNETAEDCIHRELKEELNIDVKIISRLKDYPYEYETVTINLIPFITEYVSGDLHLAEHKSSIWLNKENLITLDWAAADVPIVNDFIKSSNA